MKLDKHSYDLWLNDPTTIKLKTHLAEALKQCNLDLCDGNFLMRQGNEKDIGYKIGYKDCLLYVLEDILQQQEEPEDGESISTPWS